VAQARLRIDRQAAGHALQNHRLDFTATAHEGERPL
jgi:hypothetical protein